jgi:serine/threonine-protein kinase
MAVATRGLFPAVEGARAASDVQQGARMADMVIGSYRITKTLGVGGMGAVYAGEHTLLGRKAAIKVLLPEFSTNQELVERFFKEAVAATAIKHPGIVQIYDFGHQDDGSAYIAMEFLEGEGLDARLRRLGKLPVLQALRFTGQIASALAVAHGRGIVHRDLKPGNIFIIPDPQVAGGERIKILDFGIAKVAPAATPDAAPTAQTRVGALMGSPSYMSPEQCRGAGEIDHRADLYSVGCILFEMLTGRPPFLDNGAGYIAVLAQQLHDLPPVPSALRPDLTPELDALVWQLLAKDPAARPDTAGHLAQAVSAIAGEQVSFGSVGSMSAVTEVFDGATDVDGAVARTSARTGSGPVRAPGTGAGTAPGSMPGRLIDQLAPRQRRPTGDITGPLSAGITGRNTDQLGGIAAANQTARSRLSQQRVPTEAVQPRSGRRALIVALALLLIGGGSVALTQLGKKDTEVARPAEVEPADTAEPAAPPPPRPKRKPALTFLAAADPVATARAGAPGASAVTAAAAAPVVFRLPTFSWSALFSGSFFGGLMSSLSVIVQEPAELVTWKIMTSPPGADVLRGDQVVGNTAQPLVVELEKTPGHVETFTLRLARHRDKVIELSGDQSFDQVIELEPKVFAKIDSKPAGAQVLDAQGAVLGTAPAEIEIDPAGQSALTLRLDRYEDAAVDLSADIARAAGKGKIEKQVKLVPKIYATVVSQPAGAEVLDEQGTSLGAVPVELELPRNQAGVGGPRALTLRLDRYEDAAIELKGKKSFRQTVKLVPKVYATVASRPAGAQVFDAQGQSLGTAPVTFELPRTAQPAKVTLKLDGHQDAEAVLKGTRTFTKDVKLVPRPKLTIVSQPAGAQVFDAQGQLVGTAPVEVTLSGTGEHVAYTLKLDGHHDGHVEARTRRDQTLRATLQPQLGSVTVRIESKPAGAEVWKHGKMIGRAPFDDSFEGVAGDVKYTVKLDGYKEQEVRVPGGQSASKLIELRKCPPARQGSLGIVSVYAGC